MWTYKICIIILFVVFGKLKSISLQFMNEQDSMGRHHEHLFNNSFLQANSIFFGEFLCLVGYLMMKCFQYFTKKSSGSISTITEGSKNFNRLLLLKPAILFLMAMITSFYAQSLTYSSTFNMLKGSSIAFTACLTDKRIKLSEWIGVILIFLGVFSISIGDFDSMFKKHQEFDVYNSVINDPQMTTSEMILGQVLIVISELFMAVLFITEEDLMKSLKIPPILVAGWKGFYGFIVLSTGMVIFSVLPNNSKDDTIEGLYQIENSTALIIAEILLIFCSTFASYFAVNTTYYLSAFSRSVFDSSQMVFVWIISIILHWRVFHQLHV